ncbi:hypothetical protein ACWGNM_11720 [Streptomyces sp. NPDC055796]
MITDVVDVLAAVTADHSAFEISDRVLPRMLSMLRLIAEQTLPLHGEIAVSEKRRQARPLLTIRGRTYEITFKERQKQIRYVPKPAGRRTYDWQRVVPAQRFEPSGELEMVLAQQQGYQYGRKKEWSDTEKKPLEDQVGSVLRALRARADEQERARLEREADSVVSRTSENGRQLRTAGWRPSGRNAPSGSGRPRSVWLQSRRWTPLGPSISAQRWNSGEPQEISGPSATRWTKPPPRRRTPARLSGSGSGRRGARPRPTAWTSR